MRIIPTKIHGVLDYFAGVFLMSAPWILGFAQNGAETWVPVVIGAAAIIYSLLTNYEMGVSRTISMPVHLALDVVSGILLALSPLLFKFHGYVYMPHVVLGLGEILIAALTDPHPFGNSRKSDHIIGSQR
jgi:hypothetical protein